MDIPRGAKYYNPQTLLFDGKTAVNGPMMTSGSSRRGLTIMFWATFDKEEPGEAEGIAGMYDHRGGLAFGSWYVSRNQAGQIQLLLLAREPILSSHAFVTKEVAYKTAPQFVAFRYEPGDKVTVWTGEEKEVVETAVKALWISGGPLSIGYWRDTVRGDSGYLSGKLAHLAICNEALTNEEIVTFMEQTGMDLGV